MVEILSLEEAEQFISALTRGGTACFQTFDDCKERRDGSESKVIPKWKYGKFETLTKWLIDENAKGAGVYILVNEGDGKGRSKENITSVRAVFVDLDGTPKTALHKINPLPNIVVESSSGRYHGYWLVDDCPLERFTEVQGALAQRFNADPSVKDLSRVMRIPGFLHKKGKAFTSKLLRCETGPINKIDSLITTLGLQMDTDTPTEALETKNDGLCIPPGQRHAALAKTAGRLRNNGLSGGALLDALKAWNKNHCSPPLPESELNSLAKWGNKQDSYSNSWYGGPPPDSKKLFQQSRTFKQLSELQLDPIKWAIEGVLPEGLCILAGKPKVGKSWLTQAWCLAVANGHQAMGAFRTTRGKVLSLSLEDSPRRFKSRMISMLDGEPAPDNAYFLNEWPSMPHAATMLRKWLDQNGDTQLIIIDTLGKIQSKKQGKGNAYYTEYDDIGQIQTICHEYRLSIVIVHHLRKGESDDDIESVSGTIGITGAADTIALLKRPDRSKNLGQLIIHGRDIPGKYYDLEFQDANGLWLFRGASDDDMDELQVEIIDLMQDGVPRAKPDIIRKLYGETVEWKHRKRVERAVVSLIERDILGKSTAGRGRYVLQSSGAASHAEE